MTDTVKQEVAQPLPRGWKASDSPVKRAFAKSRLVQVACGTLLLIVLATIFAPCWPGRTRSIRPTWI
jgi:peptide/nickel transport system permease protein